MTDRSDPAYPTDIAYVRQFCSELSPQMLRATAALAGCPPPPPDDFDYGEFGSGFGDTLATLAAAHPRARFVGLDLSPTHVEAARSLASRGALENVRFVERDFEDLRKDELPPLDYAAAHGLLTWITPSKQKALFACAAARLKPGGLLYLGYNALPGWAALEPLRRFMLDAAQGIEGPRENGIRHALAAAKALCDADAAYFVQNPAAKEILATMVKMGLSYTAHEFFGAHWGPMYFADVVEEAARHDLRFVGQLPLHLNYRDLAVAPALQEPLRSLPDRRAWERAKAYANNEFFRRDVYVKGAVPHASNTAQAYLDTTPFGTLVPAADVRRAVTVPNRSIEFSGALFDALVPVLAERSSSVGTLAREPSLASFGSDALRQAVLRLAMGGDVVPMALSSGPCVPAGPASSAFHVPSAFNRAALAQALSRTYSVVLASPVAGTGVTLSTLHAVALRALTEATPAGREAWIRAFIDTNPLRLVDHGRVVVDKNDLARLVAAHTEDFRTTRLPKLAQLGVVASGNSY